MRNRLGIPLAVGAAVAVGLMAVAAPAAAEGRVERRDGTTQPAPARLTDVVARQAAWARAREFRDASSRIDTLRLNRCERDGFRRVNCNFSGRDRARPGRPPCRLAVDVRGTDSHHRTELHVSCRARPRHYLTFHRASAAIRDAAGKLFHHLAVVIVAERLSGTEIVETVETAGCYAKFTARLTSGGAIVVTHGPRAC